MRRILLMVPLWFSSLLFCSEYHFYSTPTFNLHLPFHDTHHRSQANNNSLSNIVVCGLLGLMNRHSEHRAPHYHNYQAYVPLPSTPPKPTPQQASPPPPPRPTRQEQCMAAVQQNATKQTQLCMQQYNEYGNDSAYDHHGQDDSRKKNYVQERIRRRIQAAQEASHNQQFTARTYKVPDEALQLISEKKLDRQDYQQCFGNQLQHALHQETLSIIRHTAHLYYKHDAVKKSPFTDLLIDFTSTGCSYNQHGSLLNTMTLLDSCWACLEVVSAIGHGVLKGTYNSMDPIGLLLCYANPYVGAAYYFGLAIVHVGGLGIEWWRATASNSSSMWQNCKDTISALCDAMNDSINKLPRSEKIKEGTALLTEIVLSRKVLQQAQKFIGKARVASDHFVQRLRDIAHPAEQLITPEGLLVKVASDTHTYLKMAANNIVDGAEKLPKIARVFVLNHLLADELHDLAKMYNGSRMFRGNPLHFDVVHNFLGEIYPNGALGGFHHDYLGAFRKANPHLVKVTQQLENGYYAAEVCVNGVWKRKTFFPECFSRNEVMNKILETYDKYVHNACLEGTRWKIEGIMCNEINIRIIVDEMGRVVSNYPVF